MTTPNELSENDFLKLQGQYQARYGIIMNKQVILIFVMIEEMHKKALELITQFYQKQLLEQEAHHQKQVQQLNQIINQYKQQHEIYTDEIKKAAVAISKQKGAVITENPDVVIKHNRSKYGIIGFVIIIIVAMGLWTYDRYRNELQEYKAIKKALIETPKIYKLHYLARDGNILLNPDKFTGEYLELTPPKEGEDAVAGKNYYFDKDDNRVLVPLHFSKTPLE
ncbi:MAG: hypothetical protein MUF58_02545 [Arcicella sp.]|jgi:hypothetical protein|nr:hypothetical protein [Arcicella sp.]